MTNKRILLLLFLYLKSIICFVFKWPSKWGFKWLGWFFSYWLTLNNPYSGVGAKHPTMSNRLISLHVPKHNTLSGHLTLSLGLRKILGAGSVVWRRNHSSMSSVTVKHLQACGKHYRCWATLVSKCKFYL